jgi:hypothetical protein
MLGILGDAVRGLFLGRHVHDPGVLAAMLDATEAL